MANRYKGGAYASKVKFTWDRNEYYPAGLSDKDPNELRKEYSRLRDIAVKRLERLKASKYSGYKTAQSFLYLYAPRFRKSKEMNDRQIRSALADLRYFLESPYGSVSGYREIRKKQIETLHENGMVFINEENLDDFFDFMHYVKSSELGRGRYRPEDPLFFQKAVDEGLDVDELKEEWTKWKRNQMAGTDLQNKVPSGMKNRKTVKRAEKSGKAKKVRKKTTVFRPMLNGKSPKGTKTRKTTYYKKMLNGKTARRPKSGK